jgi:aldehyde:ferredoxin oxidoreductase
VRCRTSDFGDDFIGGRALAARIYWDEVSADISAYSPENALLIMPGPLAGTPATACSRWVMAAKSPYYYPDQYSFGNGGGFFGAALKFAGCDGLIIRGRAQALSYLFIENDRVELRDAAGLRGLTTDDTLEKLRAAHGENARVLCIGPAGENLVHFAIAVTEQGGTVSSGMGAVMGAKNLKAIVVKGSNRVAVAQPEQLKEVNRRIRTLRRGLNESVYMTEPFLEGIEKVKNNPCYACPAGCMRATFRHTSGRVEVRKTCAAAFCYTPFDQPYHGQSTEVPFIATSLCDRYGLDTGEFTNLTYWLQKCFQRGILSEEEAGLPISKIGSLEYAERFVDTVVNRKGFGDLLARGVRRASIEMGPAAEAAGLERVTLSGYVNDAYGARVFMITSLFYATELRNPIIQLHEVNFLLLKWALWRTTDGAMSPVTTEDLRNIARRVWGSDQAVDFSTYEGKARAAYLIQNRQHAKEALVACDRYLPILDTDQREDHMGDPTFEPALFSAVTGRAMSEDEYYRLGERSFNMQRAIYAREGHAGRAGDSLNEFNFTEPVDHSDGVFGMFNPDLEMPGRGEEIISRKGRALGREAFEKMKDEYYALRGWDAATGLQTRKKLDELRTGNVCAELEKRGLLK